VTKRYRGGLLLALVGVMFLPASPAAAMPAGVTKALDYLRARQRADGGFSYNSASGSATTTPWAMLAIAAGGNNPSRWKSHGRSPVTFLQDTNLVTAAANSGNAPEYYALCILAYKAANRTDLLTNAGSTQIDLVGKLESYQALPYGYYAPGTGAALSTTTTAWAVLGLVAARESGPPLDAAVTWLQTAAASDGSGGGPNGDGGYGSQPATTSDTTDTALVLQALDAAQVSRQSAVMKHAAEFIKQRQTTSGSWAGGFVDTQGGYVNALSTAMAIEGLHAAGIDPHGLSQNGHSPYTFLARLLQANGSYLEFPGDLGNVMGATMEAAVALSGHWLPVAHGPNRLTRFAPSFETSSILPKNGARFAGGSVEITARYFDGAGGTGIDVHAVRVTVDGVNETHHAHVTISRVTLDLTKLSDGRHTWSVTVSDRAGNRATIEGTFTVAVPAATGGGTHSGGSGTGAGSSGTGSGGTTTHHTPTPSPTASATLSPSPSGFTPSASPFPSGSITPSASASVTGQVAGGGGGPGGGDGTAIAVGTTLAALVPLGFVGSWLVRRRLLGVMGGAARGETLPQDVSFWRSHRRAGGPPPAGEE